MRAGSVIATLVKSSPYLTRMLMDLFWTYITLGQRVRKTRKAFEKQLMMAGMSKANAERLSACFEDLKNSIRSILKQGAAGSFTQPGR